MTSRHAARRSAPTRRTLVRNLVAGMGSLAAAGAGGAALFGSGQAAAADSGRMAVPARWLGKARKARGAAVRNAGAGMHAGPDTAMGLSTFTINRRSVSCGVGSLGNSPGVVPGTSEVPTGLATSGPFAMVMYATSIEDFVVDRRERRITVQGRMRSITAMGNQVVEDVLHPFVAEGLDRRGERPDEFYLHFRTPFWNTGNPMATPSPLTDTWAMFGSPILFGEVNVG